MRLKPILLSVTLFYSLFSFGQGTVLLRNWSGSGVAFNSLGGLGNATSKAIEFPQASGRFALNRMDFWITGIDQSGDTVAFCSDIFSSKTAWVPGPTSLTGSRQHLSAAEWVAFNEVSADEVNTHKLQYANGSYTAPDGIKQWPAAFSVSGFPTVLAPYADKNQDAKYNYALGDYPFVPGEKNLFVLGSDSTDLLINGSVSSRLDMSVLWFLPKNTDSVPGTLFFRTTVCNRGTEDVDQVKVAVLGDMQIGDASDNFLVTDAELGVVTGYNAQGGDAVYGSNWPAVSMGWLSERSQNSMYFEQGADAVKGRPVAASDYYNLSNSFWKTGKFLSFGGSGLDGSIPAKFIFSNATDAAQANKDWDETAGTAGKRTALIAYKIDKLGAKTCKTADGFVSIISNAPDSAAMRVAHESIIGFYGRSGFNVSIEKPADEYPDLVAFPNPVVSGKSLYLKGFEGDSEVDILDIKGQKIATQNLRSGMLNVPVKAGLYTLHIKGYAPMKLVVISE
jgi:hypothetical protein